MLNGAHVNDMYNNYLFCIQIFGSLQNTGDSLLVSVETTFSSVLFIHLYLDKSTTAQIELPRSRSFLYFPWFQYALCTENTQVE